YSDGGTGARSCGSEDRYLPLGDRPAAPGQPADVGDELGAVGDLDAFGEGVFGVVVQDRHGDLGDDRPGVDTFVDEEQRGTGDPHAVVQRVARTVDAGERRQQSI